MASERDPRFDYTVYERNIFATREELTKLSKILLDMSSGVYSVVVSGLRVAGVLALFKIRQAMFEEEKAVGKQIYERRRSGDNSGDLGGDDQDAPPRRPDGS